MGLNAQRLMRRNVSVLQTANMLAVKIGTKQDSSYASTKPTIYHQDAMDVPIDRNGYVSFWIAPDHITADMGGMRFVDRSHALGMMGLVDLYETYPELQDKTLTEPVELAPGDAMYVGGFAWSRATLAWRAATQLQAGDGFGGMLPKVYG